MENMFLIFLSSDKVNFLGEREKPDRTLISGTGKVAEDEETLCKNSNLNVKIHTLFIAFLFLKTLAVLGHILFLML